MKIVSLIEILTIFNPERVKFDTLFLLFCPIFFFLSKIKYPRTNVEPLFPLFYRKFRKKMFERNGNRTGREEKDNNPVQSPGPQPQ